jgi:GT2 family glycosyltransferase
MVNSNGSAAENAMTAFPLSIIIVNWNSKEYVRNCLSSIVATIAGIEYEIIVVDSGSFDGCGEMVERNFPQVRFVQSGANVGFARANNLGARYARGQVLFLLNPDTEVRGNAIEQLYARFHELPRPGVIGCRLLNSDGSIQTSCVQPFPTIPNQILNCQLLQRWFPKIRIWWTALTFKDSTSPVPVEAVSGACMLIDRRLFDLVEGFSDDFFMYGEDLDLCYKTRAAGFTNYHVPEVEIVHHGGGSTQHSRFSEVMMKESVRRLLSKTHGSVYSLGYRCAITGAAAARLGVLLFVFPAALIRRRRPGWLAAFARWSSVLRWGVGLENWVREYGRPVRADDIAEA